MEVGWSRLRNFVDRSEIILLTIEAKEFINLVRKIQDEKTIEFHTKLIDKRVKSFEKFFEMFMPFFSDIKQKQFKKVLKFARTKEYNKIGKTVLDEMQDILETFAHELSAEQSRDMELLRAISLRCF